MNIPFTKKYRFLLIKNSLMGRGLPYFSTLKKRKETFTWLCLIFLMHKLVAQFIATHF